MFLYKKPEIAAASDFLWLLALCAIVESSIRGMANILLASGSTRAIFVSRVSSLPVFFVGALILVPAMGIKGLILAKGIASAVCAVVSAAAVSRVIRGRPAKPMAAGDRRSAVPGIAPGARAGGAEPSA
jgi:Na+-driven multidrug efflux pump